MRLRQLVAIVLTIFGLFSAGMLCANTPKNVAVERLKALPPPLQSSTGKLFVSCVSAERAAMRWPVMQFAEQVSTHLGETYLPLGSAISPLSIELGSQTNVVTNVKRSVFRTGDGFSQLIIRVPNPETVDLEALREAVAEALLRERVREETGRYAAFSWPKWFLTAVVNASKGNLWKAEAYERLCEQLATVTPTLEQILVKRDTSVTPEVDAFFVMWLLEETAYNKKNERLRLLCTPWSAGDLQYGLVEAEWQKWLTVQESRVFLLGALTRSQFKRWHSELVDPADTAEAMTQANGFARMMIGRPQRFRDLCELYLKAYTAYISGGESAYRALRREADEAAQILEVYFTRRDILMDEDALSTETQFQLPSDNKNAP